MTDSTLNASRIAVVGAGTMGAAMAKRLLSANFTVDVWSLHEETNAPLVELGATSHPEPKSAVAKADVVLTMLPTADVTENLMFNEQGLEAMQRDAIWVQMATIGPKATEDIASRARSLRSDVTFVDAPVSGSRAPAESGQLLILASGDESVATRLEDFFGAIGRKTMWLGPIGAGSRMKLILNTWLAFQAEGAAESLSLATRLNTDPSLVVDALRDNALASPYAVAKLQKMIDADFRPDFSIDWALKDLELVGADAGSDAAPVASVIAERWRTLVENGSSGLDVSAASRGLAVKS
jgi:3-hydroxyisobutyrate dehydrogenase